MRRVAHVLAGLIVSIVIVVLLLVVASRTERGSHWLGTTVVNRAGQSLTFDLKLSGIRGRGLSRWTLYDVHGYEKGTGDEFFRAHRVDLTMNWGAFLSSRRFEIVDATVDSLNATLWFDSTGVFHPVFPGADTTAAEPPGPGKPLPLAIKELNVQQVAFAFEERGRHRTLKLYDASIKGSGMGNEWNGTIQGWLSLRTRDQARTLPGEVTIQADLAGGILQLDRLLWLTPAGRVDAHGRWELSTGTVTAHAAGEADLDTLSVLLPALDRLSGNGSYELDVTRSLNDLVGKLTVDVHGFLLDSLEVSGLSGVASIRGYVEGPLTPPDSLVGNLDFDVNKFSGPQGTRGNISGKATLDRSLLDLVARGAGISLSARGLVLGPRAPNIHFQSAIDDVDRFLGNQGYMEGDLTLRGDYRGSWRNPDIRATYFMPVLSVHGIVDRNVRGNVSFVGNAIVFDLGTARGITGRGRAFRPTTRGGPPGPWQGDVHLSAPDFPLADIRPLLPPDWLGWFPEGRADLVADLNGTLAAPRGRIHLLGEDLRLQHNDVGVLDLTADVLPGEVRVGGTLTPARGSGVVLVGARLPLVSRRNVAVFSTRAPLTARLIFDDLVFEATPPDSAPADTLPRHIAVRGTADISMLAYRPETRRVELALDTLAIRSRRARLQTEAPLHMTLASSGFALDSVHVQVWRNDPDTLVGRIEGSLQYDGERAFSGGFVAGPIPLDLVSELLPGSPELGGTLEATVVPTGRVGSFGLAGNIDWVDPSTPEFTFDRIRSHFLYSGGVITIDSLVATADTSGVQGSGQIVLGKNGAPGTVSLDFVAENFSLGSLPVPPASFRLLAGNLDGWINVRGTTAQLLYTGEFNLDDGAVQFGPMLAPVGGIEARLRLENSTIVIDTLTAAYDKGTGELTGRFTMAANDNYGYDVTGRVDRLPLFLDPGIKVRLTGPVSLKGTTDRSQLSGHLDVTEGRYVEQFDLQRILLRREIVQVRSVRTRRLLDGMNLNLRLQADYEDFSVENNVAVIPMQLDLLILGTALEWHLAGSAEAEPEKGKIFYLDREFKVDDLTVTFDDPRRPDPRVDLLATTEVTSQGEEREDYTVNVSYGGKASEFSPVLSSDPALAQPDIVALLTLGVPVASLGFASGSSDRAGTVFLSRARELTTRGLLQLAGRRAADFVGISRVQVRSDDSDTGNTLLTVGKDFGRDVSIDYTSSLAEPGVPRLDLNWRLTRRFSLRSIADQKGESSVDFRYAFRFW